MKHIILLILLTLGIWAQEVGVPYVDYSHINIQEFAGHRKVMVSSANNTLIKLAPKGKFTVWSLQPFQKKDEFTVRYANWFNLSADERKLLITTINNDVDLEVASVASHTGITIFDLKENKVMATLPHNYLVNGMVMTGENLFTITANGFLRKWDTHAFSMLQEIESNQTTAFKNSWPGQHHQDLVKDTAWELFLNRDQTKLIIRFSNNLIIVNTKNLQILQTIKFDALLNTHCYLDVKQDIFYYGNNYCVDLNTLEIKEVNIFQNEIYKKLDAILDEKDFYWGSIPNPNHKIFAYGHKQFIKLIDSQTLDTYATFSEFSNGEWIVITPDGYFDGSPNSRQYLSIKTLSGESVPIDDVTFNKYHKKINIGE